MSHPRRQHLALAALLAAACGTTGAEPFIYPATVTGAIAPPTMKGETMEAWFA